MKTGDTDNKIIKKMKNTYLFLFYCFYSILQKKDKEKIEGATSLITILLISITFSVYLLAHVWFDLDFYCPLLEILSVAFICLTIWYLNRLYFIKNNNAGQAIEMNHDKNKTVCKILGVSLTIGQLALFIASGVATSKHVWGW